jgi:phage terminase large subunit-like protein
MNGVPSMCTADGERAGASWLLERIGRRATHVAVLGHTHAWLRRLVDTLLALSPDDLRPVYQPQRRRLVWPCDAVAHLFCAEETDQLRGYQFESALATELARRDHPAAWELLLHGLRIGSQPSVCLIGT